MDNNETKVHIALLAGVFVLIILLAFFVVTIIRYHQKRMRFQQQKTLEQFNLIDKEKERISFDLHDDLGSNLSLVKIHLQMLNDLNAEGESVVLKLEQIIDEQMKNIKRISQNLMPRILQQHGLDAALVELTDIVSESTGIQVDYWYSVDNPDPEKDLHIYRIVQESINNIVKHAIASRVSITLVAIGHKLELSIKDNGVGFQKSDFLKKTGMGLSNIVARTYILKGTLHLTTSPGEGVDYLIEIPFYGKN